MRAVRLANPKSITISDSTDVINSFTTAAVVALAELHRSLHPGLKLLSTAGDAASISALGPLVHLWIVDIDVWTAPGVGSLLSHLRRTASAEVLVYSKRGFFSSSNAHSSTS